MKGPYEFLQPLSRLTKAYLRYERIIWAMNAAIISISLYAIAEIIGIPAFMSFYYQDVILLASLPAIISIILGLVGSSLIKRRKKADIFALLGPQLSEKTRTAYDNREVDSLPMQELAAEIRASLNKIKPSDILNSRRIGGRAFVIVIISGAAILLAESEIISPSDFQSLADLRDQAISAFEGETPTMSTGQEINLTGNLYGNPSLAVLNENKMEIVLYPGIGAGSLARNTEPVERVFSQSQAGDATAVPSELYIESLPPENKDIIKRYFTILSQSDR
ncbi:MAG: hypothetical protein A4E49_01131 [Methanosaeta sp. PtaU1.Bin112]|nr:MAG: hypothetical protein A4E49_01131 [Methanosaeta sp. PtaU1.Bin112]